MRTFTALAAAILLVSPAFAVERHRATLPPRPSLCANAAIASSVSVSWFALADDTIYFADSSGGLLKVPKGGGMPMPIMSSLSVDIGTVVVDTTSVFFITQDSETIGSIYSVPRSGGTPKLLATNLPAPIDMRLDATSIYWLNLGTIMGQDVAADGSVERMLKDGTGRQKLIGNLSAPAALEVDATDVYFSETGSAIGSTVMGLRRISKSGGAVTKLVDDSAIFALALSGPDIFYSGANTNGISIARIAKSGGPPQEVLPDTLAITMVVRDSHIYVVAFDLATFGISITSMTTTGADVRVITTDDLDSGAIAVDDCALYYAANSSLLRTPR